MNTTVIENVRISGIAAAVSNTWTPISSLVDEEEQSMVKKFTKKTGVEGRYDAGANQTTSDFCFVAARELLRKKHIDPSEIGLLVFVTQTPDYRIPATACVLQDRLGLSHDTIAFDVNLGCSGFSYGVNIASSILLQSNADKALLLCGDTSAKERSPKKRTKTSHSASMLFGDSGTATLLEKDNDAPTISMVSKTDGAGYKAIISPYGAWRNPDHPEGGNNGTTMDDVAVFNFAINEVPELISRTRELNSKSTDDYDCLVLHQANLFIMKQIAKRSGFPMEKALVSLDKFGNTSSSSIPITLVKEYGSDEEARSLKVMSCGFGVGLSWSTVDFVVNSEDILPLIHTDEYFVDGYQEENSE